MPYTIFATQAGPIPLSELDANFSASVPLNILAATGTGQGASLVGFQNLGAGATARTASVKLQETVSVKDFGALGNGVTDDTAAIQAALAYCGLTGSPRTLYFPAGTYIVTSALSIGNPIRLLGDGNGSAAYEGAPAEVGTVIQYNGSAGAILLTFLNVNYGYGGVQGISFDCNSLASGGVLLDGVMGAHFECMSVRNFTTYGLKLTATSSTCSWNTFINLRFDCPPSPTSTKGALWLSGVAGGANATHNSFIGTRINFGGTSHGIYLGGCDNCSFTMTYIYRGTGGTGYSVYCDPTEQSGFPLNNSFFHLEALAGWFQPASVTARPAIIYGYMQDNGEPLPSLNSNGTTLFSCPDLVFPLTLTVGTGWSGGTATLQGWYTVYNGFVFLTLTVGGTGVVAAANATITGVPANTGNPHGLAVGTGVNTGGAGQSLYGYVNGSTLFIQSGIASTSGATMTFVYHV